MPVTQNIAPVTISFSNTSQGDGLSYLWNFGDGGTSTDANPTHTFQAGAWEVTLTVTNENGTDVSSAVIVATQPQTITGPTGEELPSGFSANDGPPPGFTPGGNNGTQTETNTGNQNTNNTGQQTMTGPPPGVVTGGAGGFNP